MVNRNLKILLITLVILLIAGGIVIFIQKKTPAGPTLTPTTTQPATTSPESQIDTSDWKTYINERWGYSFKYPKNWYLEEPTIAITMVRPWGRKEGEYSDPKRDIEIRVYPHSKDPEKEVLQPTKTEYEKRGEIMVGAEKGTEYLIYAPAGPPHIYRVIYVSTPNKFLWEISIYQQNPEMEIFNQIIKTFRFTNY